MNEYLNVLKNYANFEGRARRKEYWMFMLFHFIVIFGLIFLSSTTKSEIFIIFILIYAFATFIPSLAVRIRRMHDSGKSGWYILFPYYNLYLLCVDSQPETNEYGPNPKEEIGNEINEIGNRQD